MIWRYTFLGAVKYVELETRTFDRNTERNMYSYHAQLPLARRHWVGRGTPLGNNDCPPGGNRKGKPRGARRISGRDDASATAERSRRRAPLPTK